MHLIINVRIVIYLKSSSPLYNHSIKKKFPINFKIPKSNNVRYSLNPSIENIAKTSNPIAIAVDIDVIINSDVNVLLSFFDHVD